MYVRLSTTSQLFSLRLIGQRGRAAHLIGQRLDVEHGREGDGSGVLGDPSDCREGLPHLQEGRGGVPKRGSEEGIYRSSLDARKPQNPT